MFDINEDLNAGYNQLHITKGNFNWQRAASLMKHSKKIIIFTYGISKYNIKLLKSLNGDKKVTLIFNASTLHDPDRNKAKKIAKEMFELLNPKNFLCELECYINYTNHSKLILLDNLIYVGSANFTYKTKDNLEIGISLELSVDRIKDQIENIINHFRDSSFIVSTEEGFLPKTFEDVNSHTMISVDEEAEEFRQYAIWLSKYKYANIAECKINKFEHIGKDIKELIEDTKDLFSKLGHDLIKEYKNTSNQELKRILTKIIHFNKNNRLEKFCGLIEGINEVTEEINEIDLYSIQNARFTSIEVDDAQELAKAEKEAVLYFQQRLQDKLLPLLNNLRVSSINLLRDTIDIAYEISRSVKLEDDSLGVEDDWLKYGIKEKRLYDLHKEVLQDIYK
ncbi:phospholipase D-like domain-containing protein [Priestia aryabhattai]|uniref:phospholipase D-like domain-containing protein n=1 Tax=Priestia aryabhattai TaxID=412384 RepID=UPI0032E90689